ncbi:MAG: hypothetical protein CSA62_09850 [Planctomycetota bacterium]|nr:MAG: hypothetical protein CSA62_09850 [Planctomycetota bacterium]
MQLAWLLFAIWAAVIAWAQYQAIANDGFWAGVRIEWAKALPVLGLFLGFAGTQYFVRGEQGVARHALLWSLGLTAALLVVSDPLSLSWKFLFFCATAFLLAEAGRLLLSRIGFVRTPLWLGWLLSMALLHYLLMAAAYAGVLDIFICSVPIGLLVMLGGVHLALGSGKAWVAGGSALKMQRSEGLLLFAIVMVLLLSFISGSLPQTYTDGLVYRLPYLQALVQGGSIPQHHDLWVWAIPQPAILQMFPGYREFGEIGAAWTVLLMFGALAMVSYGFARELSGSRTLGLLAVLLIVSLPPAWILSTAIYSDIFIAAYTLGGLALLVRALQEEEAGLPTSRSWLLPAAALLGFAASIKVNAPIVILVVLAVLLMTTKAAWRLLISRSALLALGTSVAFAAPWYLWTFAQTGNPVFPFLNSVFPTKIETATIFTDEARSQFAFDPSLLNYLKLPWDLSFATSRFGSYPNGSFGPWALLLLPVLFLALLLRLLRARGQGRSEGFPLRFSLALLLAPALAFFGTSAFLGISVFRYSLAGYMLVVIAGAGLAGPFARSLRFVGAFAVLPVLFLVLIGSRMNYHVDGGIGEDVYFGEQSREQFLDKHTHGIPEYVDANIALGETLFTSMFFFVNRFCAHAYHISTESSLLGKVATMEKLRQYIDEHKVRYWVMNRATPPEYLVKQGLFEELLTEDRVVYGAGPYAVYDLRRPPTVLRRLELGVGRWSQQEALLAGKLGVSAAPATHASCELALKDGEAFVRGQVEVEAELEAATVLLHMVFHDAQRQVVARKVADARLGGQKQRLHFYTPVPGGAQSLQLILQPWREMDGAIELKGGSLQTLP